MSAVTSIQLAGLAINAGQSAQAAPAWVQLTPKAPDLRGVDGRSWRLEDPQTLVELFKREGQKLPVDICHSTEIKAPKGEPAPAVGWITDMELREGAIWAAVDWTDDGQAAINAGRYRYISPAFVVDSKTNAPVRFKSAGLTNTPNFHMTALNQGQGGLMELAAIRAALGVAEDADEAACVTAIKTMLETHETALNAAKTAPPDSTAYVPIATHQAVLARAETAEATLKTNAAEAHEAAIATSVDAAIEDGKIAPADREFYVASCQAEGGLERFGKWVAGTASKVPPSGLGDKTPGAQAGVLSADDLAACQTLGMTPDEYRNHLAAAKEA